MRHNSKLLEIEAAISGNALLFKDIKIALGRCITAGKMHALFRKNRYLEVSTATHNRIRVSVVKPKIKSKT